MYGRREYYFLSIVVKRGGISPYKDIKYIYSEFTTQELFKVYYIFDYPQFIFKMFASILRFKLKEVSDNCYYFYYKICVICFSMEEMTGGNAYDCCFSTCAHNWLYNDRRWGLVLPQGQQDRWL